MPQLHVVYALCAAVVSAALASGCGLTRTEWAFHRDLLEVDALADDEQWVEAREGYEALAPRALREDLLRYIQFRIGLMYEREGDVAAALTVYDRTVATPRSPWDHDAAAAMLRAAHLRRGDDAAAWRDALADVVLRFPDAIPADDALADLREAYAEEPEALVERLLSLWRVVEEREVGDNLIYWAARTLVEPLGRCEDALPLFAVVHAEYSRSGLADDAVWRSGECLRALGRIDEEYRLLADFFEAREVSWVMADYESVHYRPILRRLAEIHEERQEWTEAIAIWETHIAKYRLSLQQDDMLFHVMELQRNAGDPDGMRRTFRRLERDWPESRYTRRGRALLEEVAP